MSTRKIDGKVYRYQDFAMNKRDARKIAKNAKRFARSARVIPKAWVGDPRRRKIYFVYVR